MSKKINHIGIRPGVSVLSVLKHLNYKPWYAIGEFVDNAIQSFLQHKAELKKIEGRDYKLKIEIELSINGESQNIIVRDNAAGIFREEYKRAFKTAEIPPDSSGLSEFGMGMKSAACWFSNLWQVRSTAIGEDVERIVKFNISKIVKEKEEELPIKNLVIKNSKAHYTEVTLIDVHNKIAGRTIAKIKDHLASMYREFIRSGQVAIYFNGEELIFHDPKILEAPFYKEEKGGDRIWHKEIKFEVRPGLKVSGFAALRELGNTHQAGFALFRRNRLILGGPEEGYRPQQIFGNSNSFAFQRVFGELQLEGFEVSHTKDGFKWGDDEEKFIDKLKKELTKQPLNLLTQAENFRRKKNPKDAIELVAPYIKSTAKVIEEQMPGEVAGLRGMGSNNKVVEELPSAPNSFNKIINLKLKDINWEIDLQCSADPSLNDWIEVGDHLLVGHEKKDKKTKKRTRRVGIRVSLQHDFVLNFFAHNESQEGLVRIVAAIGLAEVIARESGVRGAGEVRRNINELLSGSLSKQQ